jgi:purine nucleoside phosphorylase
MSFAIIGGTGAQKIVEGSKAIVVNTEYGDVTLFENYHQGQRYFLLLRHGLGHKTPPHLINYRANIAALKKVGVKKVVAIYAVGSITDLIKPAEMTIIDQFIDFTGGSRASTFEEGKGDKVYHSLMESPFDKKLSKELLNSAKKLNIELKEGGTYICTNGPRLETAAEIAMFKQWKADCVGMTAATETILANEKRLKFAGIAYSINWAAGINSKSISFVDDKTIDSLVCKIVKVALNVL